jgi:Zn-dependent protease with chaperone function
MCQLTRIPAEDSPGLYRMTEELADRAGIPSPSLYFTHQLAPCVFIIGTSQRDRAIVFSRSMLKLLNQTELAGVMAHCLLRIRFGNTFGLTLAARLPHFLKFASKLFIPARQWYRADAASVFLLGDDLPLRSALQRWCVIN